MVPHCMAGAEPLYGVPLYGAQLYGGGTVPFSQLYHYIFQNMINYKLNVVSLTYETLV